MKSTKSQVEIMTSMAIKFKDAFPNVSLLASVGAVIPVSTAGKSPL